MQVSKPMGAAREPLRQLELGTVWGVPPVWLRYTAALVAVLLTFSAGLALDIWLREPVPFIMFFAPILFAGWYGGKGPGTVATLLSTLLMAYFFLEPRYTLLAARSFGDILRLALLLGEGLLFSWLIATMNQLRIQAEHSYAELLDAQRRLEFLSDASVELGASLDYDTTLANLARQAVPALGEWCAIDLLEADGSIRRVAVYHSDPSRVALAHELHRRFPHDPAAASGVPHVIRTGTPEFFPDISDELLVSAVQDPELLQLFRDLDLRSSIAVPLTARGHALGALTLISGRVRPRYDQDDLELAEELARRAASAVDNARLFYAGQRLNEELEQRVQERTAELETALRDLRLFSARLEWSNRELEQFASVASHDLQEPLRKIQAFGDRLKSKAGPALSDEGRDYIERMQRAAGRMQTLINDLLAFSRVTSKAQPFAPVDLAAVVADVLADLEVRIEQTGGRVEVGALPQIDADALQMRQLFQNLLGNALKFHRPDEPPHVHIRSEIIEGQQPDIAADGPARYCRLAVEDNGIGFDEKYLDRIFNVFQRLHGRNEYEGTGVGLAICRKIAERHGGSITARSAPSQGSTFIVTLPVTHAE